MSNNKNFLNSVYEICNYILNDFNQHWLSKNKLECSIAISKGASPINCFGFGWYQRLLFNGHKTVHVQNFWLVTILITLFFFQFNVLPQNEFLGTSMHFKPLQQFKRDLLIFIRNIIHSIYTNHAEVLKSLWHLPVIMVRLLIAVQIIQLDSNTEATNNNCYL